MPEKDAGDLLKGLRVLVVEDEPLVAMLIEEYLLDFGCTIAGSARRVAKGIGMLRESEIDVAVLDVNVAGESVEPLAIELEQRKIPFTFASGYGAKGIGERWSAHPILQKPFSPDDLRAALMKLLEKAP